MEEFAKELGGFIRTANGSSDAPAPRVSDKTGLTGVYEFRLEFMTSTPAPSHVGPDAEPLAADPKDAGPNLFAALEKQLGLRVVKSKNVPVDVLVIDRAAKIPAEN